MLVMDAGQLM